MRKFRMLDTYCKAGGAGMGYKWAGFEVVGVDHDPQPNYPFEFHQSDALDYISEHWRGFDAIHASPPCQRYSAITPEANRKNHPDLLGPTRDLLRSIGLPYAIENVPGAPMRDFFVLCGTMFGLETPCGAQLQRHRWFEANWDIGLIPCCDHKTSRRVVTVTGTGAPNRHLRRVITVTGSTPQRQVVHNRLRETFTAEDARIAMGIHWMRRDELSQAIPPEYTRFIGQRLLTELGGNS